MKRVPSGPLVASSAAVHALGQLARDREAEAGAARRRPGPAVEALEDALEQLGRDARARRRRRRRSHPRASSRCAASTVEPGGVWRTALSTQHAQHLEHAALVAAGERRGSDLDDDDASRGGVASGLHLARAVGRELAELELVAARP